MTLQKLELSGSYEEIGYKLGRRFRKQISSYVSQRYSFAQQEAKAQQINVSIERCKEIADSLVSPAKEWGEQAYDELCGVSKGSDVLLRDLLFAIGYSDAIDIVFDEQSISCEAKVCDRGCTAAVVISGPKSNRVTFSAQTWDMPPPTINQSLVICKRPTGGPRHISYTTILGQTHCGMNELGVCIGTNNLATSDIGTGLVFSLLIQNALLKESVEQAVDMFLSKPRLSGHNYYVIGTEGKAYNVEVTAHHHTVKKLTEGIFVHANHYHAPELRKFAIDYSPTSEAREANLREYLQSIGYHPQVSDLQVALSNHEGGICRHVKRGSAVCTCGAVIFDPANLSAHINQGYACLDNWRMYSL